MLPPAPRFPPATPAPRFPPATPAPRFPPATPPAPRSPRLTLPPHGTGRKFPPAPSSSSTMADQLSSDLASLRIDREPRNPEGRGPLKAVAWTVLGIAGAFAAYAYGK